MKKVMLTGGSGMVGRNIVEHRGFKDYHIFAPTSQELDLRDFAATKAYLHKIRPDIIIHAAGLVGGIQANIKRPVDFLVVNVDLGRNIILAAREVGVESFLNLASSCMYPRNIDSELYEELILKGELEPTNEGYAIAKIFATRLCQYINSEQARKTFKTLIPCNLYGKFDTFDSETAHLVPAVINKIHDALVAAKTCVEIWGDGQARREFMCAEDFADAIYTAVSKFETVPELMNIGMEEDNTIQDYYTIAAEVIGWKGNFTFNLDKPVGMKRKKVSIERQKKWGWSPSISLYQGIAKTYDFYLKEKSK